jgi:hypothetical protein
MNKVLASFLCAVVLALSAVSGLHAQDPGEETDGPSTEVEESDEAYRRRMELEDARQRNLGYTLPPESYAAQQEKLDKLPEESRDNIRDQLVDIIVENGEWEPSDALKDYPYEPTAAAQADPDLLEREQAAWDEQIDKYHKREAAAFGTYLGPVPGPGNPTGEEGGAQGAEGAEGSDQAGSQQSGGAGEADGAEQGGQDGSAGTAGTYNPGQSGRGASEEEVSTAGVQQSALDFLKAMHAPVTPQASPPPTPANPQASAESARQDVDSPDESAQDSPADETAVIDLATPGIIAIEDLDKLEGAEAPDDRDGSDTPR